MAKHEKQQVGLEERRKHASSKVKKLKKSIQEVFFSHVLLHHSKYLQEERSRGEALRTLDTNTSKIDKERSKLEEHETALAKEENVLEEIRDSLKGNSTPSHFFGC